MTSSGTVTSSQQKKLSIQEWMSSYVESDCFPGILAGIYNENSEEIFFHSVSKDNKYQKDSLFRIYSMTKPITVVAFLILMERGLINLEDEVSKFIPSFKETQVLTGGTIDNYTTEPCQTPLTVRHLLTHTGGISYAIFGNTLNDQLLRKNIGEDVKNWFKYTTLEDLVDGIAKSHLSFQPGTKFHYSLSIDVIGRIIEILSEMPLDEFFEKEIFEPLGMNDTSFQVSSDQLDRLVECYEVSLGHNYKVSESAERDRAHKPILLAGGGGLVSTITDYSKFACCLLNKGRISGSDNRLLKEETVNLMSSNHLPNGSNIHDMSYDQGFSETLGRGFGFGLGVSVVINHDAVKGGSNGSEGEYGWGGVGKIFTLLSSLSHILAAFADSL
jgi:CubicO group peptidase (beta-lactamase class C family)